MASSDERREVARRIRNNLDEQASWVIPWTVFNDADHHGDRETMERLADLIDPTCEVDSIEPVEYGEFNQAIGSAFHLTCGHTVMRALTDTPPAYCEECGARLVDDDD